MPAAHRETRPESIDAPSMRRAGAELLSLALMDARNHALHLLSHFEPVALPDAPPPRTPAESPLWLAGNIGWLAEYWIGRNPQRALGPACPAETVRLASIEPMADSWFDPALVTPGERWGLPLPGYEAIRAWLLQTLESTLELLEKAPDTDAALYFYRMALFHEDLRCEQLVALAQALGVPLKLPLPGGAAARDPVLVPAGQWLLGSPAEGFSFDVERPAHEVAVPEFEIDAQPVAWSQYVEFVQDGGYDRAELWHPRAGNGWRTRWRAKAAAGRATSSRSAVRAAPCWPRSSDVPPAWPAGRACCTSRGGKRMPGPAGPAGACRRKSNGRWPLTWRTAAAFAGATCANGPRPRCGPGPVSYRIAGPGTPASRRSRCSGWPRYSAALRSPRGPA